MDPRFGLLEFDSAGWIQIVQSYVQSEEFVETI
jgi:hypothetical protein